MIREKHYKNPIERDKIKEILKKQNFYLDLQIEEIGGFDLSIEDWQKIHSSNNYWRKKDFIQDPAAKKRFTLNAIRKYLTH